MRTIALAGFAETTRPLAYGLPPEVELWTLNRLWSLSPHFTKIDRLFEMHRWEYLADPNCADTKESRRLGEKAHIDWLAEPHPYPVYMLESYAGAPSAVPYPLEGVSRDVFCHLWRGAENVELYASTFDYMLGLAIHERPARIEIYGFEMATGTEYAYQRDSGMILCGLAAGRGIDVWIPDGSGLIPRLKKYGYEGAQMVSRQTLEGYRRTAVQERDRFKALANARIGILQHIASNGAKPEEIERAQEEHVAALRMLDKWDGIKQILDMLIAECDLQEVDPAAIVQALPISNFGGNNGNHHPLEHAGK